MRLMMFNLAISWGLLLLIWSVQVIIYPGFYRIPPAIFIDYHKWYVNRISFIVLPLMISEAGMTTWWLLDANTPGAFISTVLVVIIWSSTLLLQVPIHNRLKSGKKEVLIRRLVATNWIRTIAWSLKSLVITLTVINLL